MTRSTIAISLARGGMVLCLCLSSLLPTLAQQEEVWIDVRSAREYRQGHVEGAINIPHGEIGHKVLQLVPDTFVEVHLYDASQGTYAGLALELMMEMGYQAVINEGCYEQVLQRKAQQAEAEQ